jgi:hypothetical protein|tara:strand:- start:25 stop:327 length:303 start_codon:yes stop_codon:yes gene_type:complete
MTKPPKPESDYHVPPIGIEDLIRSQKEYDPTLGNLIWGIMETAKDVLRAEGYGLVDEAEVDRESIDSEWSNEIRHLTPSFFERKCEYSDEENIKLSRVCS